MDSQKLLFFSMLGLLVFSSCREKEADPAIGDTTKATYYQEAHRPQFHFSPQANWMNDPNGMVFYQGEYHLFYQYYPDSNVWGPMHWGHAVSEDLTHWEHLPIGLYPDEHGYIFSGSAVVDHKNTSGFGLEGKAPLVAIFTYHDTTGERAGAIDFQTQGIAYSNDQGRHWTKYEGNPVIENPGIRDFRDPKVFWHEQSAQWTMIFAAKDRIRLYSSPDLKNWTFESEFGKQYGTHAGVWECPDLFELPIEGSGASKWVMLVSINPGGPNGGSATQYFIGDFDGKSFTLDPDYKLEVSPVGDSEKAVFLEYGRDDYAGVSWSDVPENDGRRLFIGWMSNWDYAQVVPTYVWRSAMTLPRSLHLKKINGKFRLVSLPVDELQRLRIGEEIHFHATELEGEELLPEKAQSHLPLLELALTASEIGKGKIGVILSNAQTGESYRIGYDGEKGMYFSDRTNAGNHDFSDTFAREIHYAPKISTSNEISMHIFIDIASAELFADEGLSVMTDIFFPSKEFDTISLFSEGSLAKIEGKVWPLKSIWKEDSTF